MARGGHEITHLTTKLPKCPFAIRPPKVAAAKQRTIRPRISLIYQSLTLIFYDKTKLKVAFLTRFPRTRQLNALAKACRGVFFAKPRQRQVAKSMREGRDG